MRTTVHPLLLRITKRVDTSVRAYEVRSDAERSAKLSPTVTLSPGARITNFYGDPNAIVIGSHTQVLGQLVVFWDGGMIRIGEWSYVGEGSRIWSQASISIGNHVIISHLVDIHDTNGHPIDWKERRLDVQTLMSGKGYRSPTKTLSKPIVIEDDVWIGFKATILKGVRIGRGAIVAAGSVVVGDVPDWTIVAGNPAKVVRELEGE